MAWKNNTIYHQGAGHKEICPLLQHWGRALMHQPRAAADRDTAPACGLPDYQSDETLRTEMLGLLQARTCRTAVQKKQK